MGAHLNSFRIFFVVKEEIQPTNLFIFISSCLSYISNDISNIDHFVSIQISYRKN